MEERDEEKGKKKSPEKKKKNTNVVRRIRKWTIYEWMNDQTYLVFVSACAVTSNIIT